MGMPDCPDRTELEGFALGSLAGPSFAPVCAHVEHCTDCESVLQVLDHLNDPLFTQLRRLGGRMAPKRSQFPTS